MIVGWSASVGPAVNTGQFSMAANDASWGWHVLGKHVLEQRRKIRSIDLSHATQEMK